ncbi:ATP-dependent DNA helicase [Actinobacillus equuli]|nr:ATP-dependent DNA helicase [Actinobacillus equuli]
MYGIGKEQSQDYWLSIIRQLIHLGLIRQNIVNHSALQLTEEARPVLRSEKKLELAMPRLTFSATAYVQKQTSVRYDKDLFARLRFLRKQIADKEISHLMWYSMMQLCKKWRNFTA